MARFGMHQRRRRATAVVGAALVMLSVTSAVAGPSVEWVSSEQPLPDSCPLGDAQVGADLEPSVRTNPTNPKNLIVAWQRDRSRDYGGSRTFGVATSFDGAKTWSSSTVPGFGCLSTEDQKVTDSWVSFGPDGTAYLIGLNFQIDRGYGVVPRDVAPATTDDPSHVIVSTSTDGGRSWSPVRDVARGVSFDKPTITADPYRAGTAYATWMQYEFYACNVQCGLASAMMYSRTDDGGLTWSPSRPIATSVAPIETVQPAEIAVLPDGTLVALHTFFDYAYDTVGNAQRCFDDAAAKTTCGRWTVRSQTSTDGGLTWSLPLAVAGGPALDPVSEPDAGPDGGHATVRTSGGWVIIGVATHRSHVYIAWINRYFETPPDDGRVAEVGVAGSGDGGRSWEIKPALPLRADAFTPSIDVADNGVVAVTWYDVESDRPGDSQFSADLRAATSSDDGLTWTRRHVAGPFDLRQAAQSSNLGGPWVFVGDYNGLTHTKNQFVAAFTMSGLPSVSGPSDIFTARFPAG